MIAILKKFAGLGMVCCVMGAAPHQDEVHSMISKARWAATAFDMKNISTLLDCSYALNGSYPEDFEAWMSQHFSVIVPGKELTKDHWGRDYRYEAEGEQLTLISNGADGQPETEDDLVYVR